jgi:hypothetical protein
MSLRIAVVTVALWLLTAGAVAEAKVTLRISPRTPTTADDIVVRFKTDRNLRPGERYFFQMFNGRESASCKSAYLMTSRKRPRKGKTMTMRLRAVDGLDNETQEGPNDDATTWCAGRASLDVYTTINSGRLHALSGASKKFSIRRADDGS